MNVFAKTFRSRRSSRRFGLSLAVILTIALFAGTAQAQSTNKVGTSAAIFLRIPAGARASSLGSAYSAQANDATSLYWNPGATSRLQGYQFSFDYTDWLPGLDYGFLGGSLPIGNQMSLGVVATYLSTEDMEVTTPDYPMGTGETYNAASTSVGASLSSRLTNRFSIGGTVKLIQERIYNTTANGLAIDIGTLFDTPFRGIRLGVSISNVGTKLKMSGEDLNVRVDVAPEQVGNNESVVGELKTDSFDSPMILRLGLSGDAYKSDYYRLTWMVDGVNPNDDAISMNVGAELGLMRDALMLRAGYNDLFLEESIRGVTFGAGIKMRTGASLVIIDYAFQAFKYLGGVNRFTLNLML